MSSLTPPNLSSSARENVELGAQFLLADFDNLRQYKEQSDSLSDKRTDVLITLTSGLGAGLVFLFQSLTNKATILPVAFVVTLAVFLMSIVTLRQIVSAEINSTEYIRAANRIRAYFADAAPHIQAYLLAPIRHDYPRFGRASRNRAVVLGIASVSAGTLAGIGDFSSRRALDLLDIGVVSGVSVLMLLVLLLYTNGLYRRAERRAKQGGSKEEALE